MNIVKKFFSFSIGTWVGAIFGAIAVPVLTHYFSPVEFGKASMFTLALNMLMLISLFGVDQAFVRFFYEEQTSTLLKNSLRVVGSVFTFVTILIFTFRRELSIFLFEEYNFKVILFLWLSVLTYLIIRFGTLILRMNQKGIIYSLNQILLRSLDLGFILLLFYLLGDSYETIIAAKFLTFFLVGVFLVCYDFKLWKSIFKKCRKVVFSTKEIFIYSYPLAFTGLITWLFQSADRFAIKEWSTLNELGVYVVGYRIVAVLSIVQASFTTYWTPLALEKFISRGCDVSNKIFFRKVCGVISFIMLSISVLVIMLKDLVPSLLGVEYANCVYIIPLLVFMPSMYTISEVTFIGVSFYKKPKKMLLISVLVCTFNILGNLLLVPQLGSLGAAISTAISYILFLSLRTYFSIKLFKVNYDLKKMYSVITLLFLYALYSAFFKWTILNLFFGIILLSVLFFLYYEYILFIYNYIRRNVISKSI